MLSSFLDAVDWLYLIFFLRFLICVGMGGASTAMLVLGVGGWEVGSDLLGWAG